MTGYAIPVGLSGLRRAVDMVTPEASTIWGFTLLALAVTGLALNWRHPALHPWLLFLASRAVVTVLFFGYARQGATAIPVLALLSALAIAPLLDRLPRRTAAALTAAFCITAALDVARVIARPAPLLDSRSFGATDPDHSDLHRDQRLEM